LIVSSDNLKSVDTPLLLKLLVVRRSDGGRAHNAVVRASRIKDRIDIDIAELEQEIRRREGNPIY